MDNYEDSFAFVQYHGNDGYETPWSNGRFGFYGVTAFPTSWFDGTIERVGAWPFSTYRADFLNRRNVATDVTIDLTASPRGTQAYDVRAQVCVEPGGAGKSMRIYIVQVLDR